MMRDIGASYKAWRPLVAAAVQGGRVDQEKIVTMVGQFDHVGVEAVERRAVHAARGDAAPDPGRTP